MCTACGEIKSLDHFHKDISKKTGHLPKCKVCRLDQYEKCRRERGIVKQSKLPHAERRRRQRERALLKSRADPIANAARSRNWARRNPEKAVDRANNWRKNNPERHKQLSRMQGHRRRARKLERIPSWYDTKHMRIVMDNCPDGYDIDHIVPLVGLTSEGYEVSGLHVHWNLQYLPLRQNRRKWRYMGSDHIALAFCPHIVAANWTSP